MSPTTIKQGNDFTACPACHAFMASKTPVSGRQIGAMAREIEAQTGGPISRAMLRKALRDRGLLLDEE